MFIKFLLDSLWFNLVHIIFHFNFFSWQRAQWHHMIIIKSHKLNGHGAVKTGSSSGDWCHMMRGAIWLLNWAHVMLIKIFRQLDIHFFFFFTIKFSMRHVYVCSQQFFTMACLLLTNKMHVLCLRSINTKQRLCVVIFNIFTFDVTLQTTITAWRSGLMRKNVLNYGDFKNRILDIYYWFIKKIQCFMHSLFCLA